MKGSKIREFRASSPHMQVRSPRINARRDKPSSGQPSSTRTQHSSTSYGDFRVPSVGGKPLTLDMKPLTVALLPLPSSRTLTHQKRAISAHPNLISGSNERRLRMGGAGSGAVKQASEVHLVSTTNQTVALTKIEMDRQELRQWPVLENAPVGGRGAAVLTLKHNLLTRISPNTTLHFVVLLDLYHNRLTSLAGLGELPALRVLLVAKNRLTQLDGLREVAHLEVLDLHGNQLQHLHGLNSLKKLRVLNVAGNILREVSGLRGLDSLLELNLRRNLIRTVVDLNYLPRLQKLFLAHNEIFRYEDMSCVQSCLKLKELSLHHNPLSRNGLYFYTALTKFYRLKRLDERDIDLETRKTSEKALQKAKEREKARDGNSNSATSRAKAITSARDNWLRLKGAHKKLRQEPGNVNAKEQTQVEETGKEENDEQNESEDESSESEINNVDTTNTEPERVESTCVLEPEQVMPTIEISEDVGYVTVESNNETTETSDKETVTQDSNESESAKFHNQINTEVNNNVKTAVGIAIKRGRSTVELLPIKQATETKPETTQPIKRSTSCWNLVPSIHQNSTRGSSNNTLPQRRIIRSTAAQNSPAQKPKPLQKTASSRSFTTLQEASKGLTETKRPNTACFKTNSGNLVPNTSSSDSEEPSEAAKRNANTKQMINTLLKVPSSSRRSLEKNDCENGIKESRSENNKSEEPTDAAKDTSSEVLARSSPVSEHKPVSFKFNVAPINFNEKGIKLSSSSSHDESCKEQKRESNDLESKLSTKHRNANETKIGRHDHFSTAHDFGSKKANASTTQTDSPSSNNSTPNSNKATSDTDNVSGDGSGMLKYQGKQYLAELSSNNLSLYGPGALACLDMVWEKNAATSATTAKFQYIGFDQVIPTFAKLRTKFPKLQNFVFEENNLSRCGQFNALAELHQVRSLHISSEGNPVTEDDQWRLYAIFRLTHWGLMVINGVPVTDDERQEAAVRFGPLSQLAFQCLPSDHLTALLVANKSRTSSSEEMDEQTAAAALSAPHLQELIGKEALQYSVSARERSGSEDSPVESGRRASRRLLLWAIESAERFTMLESVWPAVLHDLTRDAITDFAKPNYSKSLLDTLKAQMRVTK